MNYTDLKNHKGKPEKPKAICKVFGCPIELSLQEQLCGEVCLEHSGSATIVKNHNTTWEITKKIQ